MSEATTYRVRSVVDFLSIPEERRPVALHEFGVWLRLRESFSTVLGELAEIVAFPEEFVWVDDDLGEGRVILKDDDGRAILDVKGKIAGAPNVG
jgi:hypothetical protein